MANSLFIGSSNVRRSWGAVPSALTRTSLLVTCTTLTTLSASLAQVNTKVSHCVIEVLPNFICDCCSHLTTDTRRLLAINGMLSEFADLIQPYAESLPKVWFLIAVPLVCTNPPWYPRLSSHFGPMLAKVVSIGLNNVNLLSPFTRAELDHDGVHLTPTSGKLFIEHLFSSADNFVHRQTHEASIRARMNDLEVLSLAHQAAVSSQRLSNVEDLGMVRHAKFLEEQDGRRNEDSERRLVFTGVKRVIGHGDELQGLLKNAVKSILLRAIPEFNCELRFVRQIQARGDKTVWMVDFATRTDAVETRRKFGQFMKREKDMAPPELKSVYCSATQTFSTRVRVSILREICLCHAERNPGLKVYVTAFSSRPTLNIHPENRPMEVLTFVECVTRFGGLLSKDFVSKTSVFASSNLKGKLQEYFLVLSDNRQKQSAGSGSTPGPTPGTSSGATGGLDSSMVSLTDENATPKQSSGLKRKRLSGDFFQSSQESKIPKNAST